MELCIIAAFLLLYVTLFTCQAATVRYRQGRLVGEAPLSVKDNLSVAAARQLCHDLEECVSFGYESSNTRFPAISITASFFGYADWHVFLETGQPAFVEDPAWHLYVNTTRERAAIPREVQTILGQLDKLSRSCSATTLSDDDTSSTSSSKQQQRQQRLRSSVSNSNRGDPASQQKEKTMECVRTQALLLDAIFHIVFPKEIKPLAAPALIPTMLSISQNKSLHQDVRMAALTNLLVIADSAETAPMLVNAGVYEAMKAIILDERTDEHWEGLPILALDVISNICLYRTANHQLLRKGAPLLLQQIMMHSTGFPELQSVLALLHLGDARPLHEKDDGDSDSIHGLSKDTLIELVGLLQNSIDGDVVYGILWDLIPGPLSAIQLLIELEQKQQLAKGKQSDDQSAVLVGALVDAGLVEHLLRILESTACLVASHTEATLQILEGLAHLSRRAREMIWMTAGTIKQAQQRLKEYERPAKLAEELTALVSRPDYFDTFRAFEL